MILSWSNLYQLQVLIVTHRTHDIMIFGGMNGKLLKKIYYLFKYAKETCKPNNRGLNGDRITDTNNNMDFMIFYALRI